MREPGVFSGYEGAERAPEPPSPTHGLGFVIPTSARALVRTDLQLTVPAFGGQRDT